MQQPHVASTLGSSDAGPSHHHREVLFNTQKSSGKMIAWRPFPQPHHHTKPRDTPHAQGWATGPSPPCLEQSWCLRHLLCLHCSSASLPTGWTGLSAQSSRQCQGWRVSQSWARPGLRIPPRLPLDCSSLEPLLPPQQNHPGPGQPGQ